MPARNPILLIAEAPMKHTPALQRGYDLAQRAQAPVQIGLFVRDPLIERSAAAVHPDVMRLARKAFLDDHRAWLDDLAARWTDDGLAVTTDVVWAPHPHEAIVTKVLDTDPFVVIKDVGQAHGLSRLLYTALDWKLLRYCPAPVLLVHAQSAHLPRRVLAAVDTSSGEPEEAALNERIVAEAQRHGGYGDAEVHLAHVFPFTPLSQVPYRVLDRLYGDIRQHDFDAFRAYAERHQIAPAARHWIEGPTTDELALLARRHEIDLVVLGSAYRSAFDRMMIGSTAESFLAHLACDVLVVKPREFAAELNAHVDLPAWRQRSSAAGQSAGPRPPRAAAAV